MTQKCIPGNELFQELCEDAQTWGGGEVLWGANVGGTTTDEENLGVLKERGLVTEKVDEDDGARWVRFTTAGREYSLDLYGYEPGNPKDS